MNSPSGTVPSFSHFSWILNCARCSGVRLLLSDLSTEVSSDISSWTSDSGNMAWLDVRKAKLESRVARKPVWVWLLWDIWTLYHDNNSWKTDLLNYCLLLQESRVVTQWIWRKAQWGSGPNQCVNAVPKVVIFGRVTHWDTTYKWSCTQLNTKTGIQRLLLTWRLVPTPGRSTIVSDRKSVV